MSITHRVLRVPLALALCLGLLGTAAAPTRAESKPAPGAEAPAPVKKLDLNAATESQLIDLPKIGPATAQRILEYRKQVGQFRNVDELLNVKGIGEKTLEELRPLVTVSAPDKAPKP